MLMKTLPGVRGRPPNIFFFLRRLRTLLAKDTKSAMQQGDRKGSPPTIHGLASHFIRVL